MKTTAKISVFLCRFQNFSYLCAKLIDDITLNSSMNLRQLMTAFVGLLICLHVSATTADVRMVINAANRGPMTNDYQYGLFFEEINHAGDGGLYAELIRNRSFEDNGDYPDEWFTLGDATMELTTDYSLNDAQYESLLLNISGASESNMAGVGNNGFWGMNVVAGTTYELIFFMRQISGNFKGRLYARLLSEDGSSVCGEALVEGTPVTGEWVKLTARIIATASDPRGRFALVTPVDGSMQLDVVSLFPPTWKGRKNGLRSDLAELLAATHPSFLRFPGGCYVEGCGEDTSNAFQWKKTLGPIETRPGHWNYNWGYRSSDGLGYDEYLQMCEDLGAAPMFVVNVGLGHDYAVPLDQIQPLIQDCLDAIEYANGDASTTWGARRVANGHAAPYNLKFIEIGNENYQESGWLSDHYAERYNMFYTAIQEKYPDMVIIGNVDAMGNDNPRWLNDYPVELVDEHYYRHYSWMRHNYRKYDSYSRKIGVYCGEYAANSGDYGNYGNVNSALGEAVFMLGMERNSDVCRMASFAPIFTHEKNPCWHYDMIHFSASSNFCTPSYYVQQLLPQYLGKQNLKWTEEGNGLTDMGQKRVGVGSWNTAVSYTEMTVCDADGTVIMQPGLNDGRDDWTLGAGRWYEAQGVLAQSEIAENCTAVFVKSCAHEHYKYKLKARKESGREGFLIIFNYQDENNFVWWNIGGWDNTKHGVEVCSDGVKSTVASVDGAVSTGEWYDIEIEVDGPQVTCRLNGETVHRFELPSEQRLYQSVQIDEDNGKLYVKVVNPFNKAITLDLQLKGMTTTGGKLVRLGGGNGEAENDMEHPYHIVPVEGSVGADLSCLVMAPYSLTILELDVTMGGEPDQWASYEEEDADKYGYLYAHMHSSQEYSCYALSRDGETFNDLFGSASVIDNSQFTVTGGMRDAFVYRTQSGRFMLAGTDMTSYLGWESNHIMTFLLSNDLVHWDKYLSVDLKSEENLAAIGVTADQITAAWAPQIIFDPVTGKYMAYYAIGFKGDRHRIYYSLMNEDLTGFTTPRLLFDPGTDVIDADIVYNQTDRQYVMIYKGEREGDKCLYQATAPYLVPTAQTTGTCQWNIVDDFKVWENGAIEGCSTYRPIGSRAWRLAYMQYSGGYAFKVRELDEHCLNPSASTVINGRLAAQHGSFIKLTQQEYEHLQNWEKVVALLGKAARLDQTTALNRAIALGEKALQESDTFEQEYANMKQAAEALERVVNNTDDNPNTPDVKVQEGVFYLRNVQSGQYLGAANTWGTQASLLDGGLDISISETFGGDWLLDTRVSNGNGAQYLAMTDDNSYYCDQPMMPWTFVVRDDKTYALTCNGTDYLCCDSESSVVTSTTELSAPEAAWLLVPAAERREALLSAMQQATNDHPVDATFLIQAPNFNRNDLRNQEYWNGWPTVGGVVTNTCAEKYNQAFDVWQEIGNVPVGLYKVKVQGFYREGGDGPYVAEELRSNNEEHLYARLYANEKEKSLLSIFDGPCSTGVETVFGYVPDDMNTASQLFSEGAYENELWVRVEDGVLRLGIVKTEEVSCDWTIFDNFRLTYYGPEAKDPDGTTAVGDANGDGEVDVADVVAIVNYILEKPAENFNFKAADVNHDNVIDAADVVGVVNIILGDGNVNAARVREVLRDNGFIF